MAKVTKRAVSNGRRNTPIEDASIFKRGNTLRFNWLAGTNDRQTDNDLIIEPSE